MTTNVPESGVMGTGFPGRQEDLEEQGLPLQAGGESRRECGPSNFCVHDKLKHRCKECKGSSICLHNKNRECGGESEPKFSSQADWEEEGLLGMFGDDAEQSLGGVIASSAGSEWDSCDTPLQQQSA